MQSNKYGQLKNFFVHIYNNFQIHKSYIQNNCGLGIFFSIKRQPYYLLRPLCSTWTYSVNMCEHTYHCGLWRKVFLQWQFHSYKSDCIVVNSPDPKLPPVTKHIQFSAFKNISAKRNIKNISTVIWRTFTSKVCVLYVL